MEKIFAIDYKLRYAETSDWGTEYLRASNREQALSIFAKSKGIRRTKFKSFDDWQWEEGVWSAEFRNIKLVIEEPCPHCNGTGTK
jgi:hypothetical protein